MSTQAPEIRPQEQPGGDRVRESTDPQVVERRDAETEAHVRRYRDASVAQLTRRIGEVERESDIERLLAVNASVLALTGLGAGTFVDRRFLAVPAVVLAFLLQHGVQGWCPPLPVFRRLGYRSRQEIDAEKYALKVLRGDFDAVDGSS